MNWQCLIILVTLFFNVVFTQKTSSDRKDVIPWERSWRTFPLSIGSWSLQDQIPMTSENDDYGRGKKKKFKVKKKLKQMVLPLLLAYKLKFFTLIPILVGGLLLLTTATGLAGFFFALFAAAMSFKNGFSH